MRFFLTIWLLLSTSVLLQSYSQDPRSDKLNDPGPQRKTGCSDPRYVAAELAAYQTLLKTRAEAEQILENEITAIEQRKKERLARFNLRYVEGLNSCGNDTACSTANKKIYDHDAADALDYYKNSLITAQDKAADAKEIARDIYDKEVKKAEKLYCTTGYRATGQTTDVVYSGEICNLQKPFTILGTYTSMIIEFKFIPHSSTNAGTASYSYTTGEITLSGSGNYIIKEPETDSPKIVWTVSMTMTGPRISRQNSGTAEINIILVPLDTECKQ